TNDFVDNIYVEVSRDKSCADPLNGVWPWGLPAEYCGAIGFDSDDLYVGILLLQITANAGDGSARSNASDKDVDILSAIVPDFWAGGLLVCERVGGVFE